MSRRHKPHLRCAECRMHLSLCICALLPRLETRTRVVLLLHQLEIDKPTNTGLVAARCLTNSAVVYPRPRACQHAPGVPDLGAGSMAEAGRAPGRGVSSRLTRAAFLFPHPSAATPLEEWRAGDVPVTLIVPDGTGSQAARARSRLGGVLALPCVTLPATEAARLDEAPVGRLRAPTRPGRLATLEAVALALGVLEGLEVEAALMRVFRVMTDRTLWTNGRLAREAVTGGVPVDARAHDPLGARPDRRTPAEP